MARDPFGRRRRAGAEGSPVEQLEVWRDWRHDTAEFEPVPGAEPADRSRSRRRLRAGVVLAAALVFGALSLSGLTALGVGPVAHLISSGAGDGDGKGAAPVRTPTADPTASASTGTTTPSTSSTIPSTIPSTNGNPPGPAGEKKRPGAPAERPGRRAAPPGPQGGPRS